MKDIGKPLHGVKVYSDPEVPPGTLFMLHKDFRNGQPKRSGVLTNVSDPVIKRSLWEKIKGWFQHLQNNRIGK